MTWLTWRQFRFQAVVAAAALAVLAILLAITGMQLAHLYSTSGLGTCDGNCASIAGSFFSQVTAGIYGPLFYAGIAVMYAVPALIGLFWGAPLVAREVEAGTFRLAWNQSITRTRWIAVKLALTGLAAMATAGLVSLMTSWWASPIERALQAGSRNPQAQFGQLAPLVFAARGVAPLGYAAFAFVLGVTAGVLIRRTVPAMAVTLAVFTAIQVIMPVWVRPHLMTPLQSASALNPASIDTLMLGNNNALTVIAAVNQPGAWVISNQTIDPAGHVFTGPATTACQTGSPQACYSWLAGQHLRQFVTYQPASRFWDFQWYETGIFLVMTLALAAFCAWRISRRRLA
jgi:ABC-type transport system involved in multi-copper enzyme maturation permease subunit